VVVENRGGGSGFVGADVVAKSPPDGYTVLLGDTAALAINASVRKDLPVDIERDLAPVTIIASLPSMLVANPALRASTLKDLVAEAKAKPGALAYASPGVGTPHHLAGVLFTREAGIVLTHVPYKGGGPMITDVVGGQVPLLITGALATLPFLQDGKLKPVAISSRTRNARLPQVPTFVESGYPNFEVEVFFGMFVPAKAPPEVAAALQKAVARALANPEVRSKLEDQTMVLHGTGPDALRSRFRAETAKWGELIRSAGITLE